LAEFREASQFSTWLISHHFEPVVDEAAKAQTQPTEYFLDDDLRVDGELLPRDIADWAPNAEQLYWASELRGILTRALEEGKSDLADGFVLRDIEGLSIEQTGAGDEFEHFRGEGAAMESSIAKLREHLNKYFTTHAQSARPRLVPLDSRTGRILGFVAECLQYRHLSYSSLPALTDLRTTYSDNSTCDEHECQNSLSIVARLIRVLGKPPAL